MLLDILTRLQLTRYHEGNPSQKKILYPQRDERNSRGTTLISQSNAPRSPLAGREESSRAGSLTLHEPAGRTFFWPVLVDISLSSNGEVPAGSTQSFLPAAQE